LILVKNQRAKILDYLSQNISKKKIRPDVFQKTQADPENSPVILVRFW
jgi:hypothetical protein